MKGTGRISSRSNSLPKKSGIDESSGCQLYHVGAGAAGRPNVVGDCDAQAAASEGKLSSTLCVPEGPFQIENRRSLTAEGGQFETFVDAASNDRPSTNESFENV